MPGKAPDSAGQGQATPGGRWVRVTDAAQLLGVSERTIRRWIQAGRLPSDDMGSATRVDVSGERQAQGPATPDMPDSAGHDVELAELRVRVQMLTEQRERLEEQLDHWRRQAEAALVNQRLLLEAPKQRRFRWPWERGEEE